MQWLIWIGAGITLLGFAGVVLSMLRIMRAKRAQLSDEELRARLQTALPLNIGGLFLAFLGLMILMVGAMLG